MARKKSPVSLEEITQQGAAVPSGWTYNPRLDPPLFETKNAPEPVKVPAGTPRIEEVPGEVESNDDDREE